MSTPNEYTTKNQWLSYIYNTVPEQYKCCTVYFILLVVLFTCSLFVL